MNTRGRTSQIVLRGMAWALILCLGLAACSTQTSPPATEAPIPTLIEAPTEPPTAAATEAPTEPPMERPLSGLSANPQRVEFQAEDGKNLVGYYYPSKYANAPIVILMHWAGGNLTDWCEIAPWLQNRKDESPVKPERCASAGSGLPASIATHWLDPSWFPAMNPDVSLAVFAFDFRNYGESEAGSSGEDQTKDALAAFKTAAGFEGVDATRMATMGASIGADGAPDGCLLYNQEAGSGCVGALSLSPGSFLGMNYGDVVNDLRPVTTWCLAAEGDAPASTECNSASGESYRTILYADIDLHGMRLIAPDLEPQPMILIQEFLELVFGEAVK